VTELTINPTRESDSGFTIHAEFVQRTYIYKEETPEPETEQ